ncbi:MAG: phosphate ABC transporter substrate-binding protein [Defluviitaleaceae bacterium]|nr:phosphate ABC transporter substrate-binding protein [Defluviitaleaceae bacterium]
MKKIIAIATFAFLSACSNGNPATLTAEQSVAGNEIVIAGSTTVAPVAQALADAFMETNPGYVLEVQSMGTGAGMTAATEGVADIGLASRDLTSDELTELDFLTFAIDGIAVIVHENNPVYNLSFDEIRSIFLGEITNWSDVGGNNAEIIVISREAGSGARGSFEALANVADEVSYFQIANGSNGVLTTVEQNPNAISYVTYGLLVGRSVTAVSVDGIPFTGEGAFDGTYPFAIGFHMAFQRAGVSSAAQTFLDWVMSPAGQAIVVYEEYVPVA